jgi:hypothetical protein
VTRLPIVLALAAGLSSGCGDATTPTSPSTPADAVAATTRLFTGTLAAGDTQFYSFTVPQDSGVFLTLASVTAPGERAAGDRPIRLGLGVPRGTGCAVATEIVTGPALTAQIREWTRKGVHCAAVADPGTLTTSVAFAVRIGYFQ